MRTKKIKRTPHKNIRESNLDLFVWNLDRSQCNSYTKVWRGGNCLEAKNIIVFGRDNKRKKEALHSLQTKSTKSLTHKHWAGVIDYGHKLQDVTETVLTEL